MKIDLPPPDPATEVAFASRLAWAVAENQAKKLPAYWLARLYVAMSVLYITLLSVYDTGTMAYRLVGNSGGTVPMLVLAGVALMALADVVINDLLPRRFRFAFACHYRHLIYMAMALGLVSTGFIVAKEHGLATLHARLSIDAAVATAVAFFDLFARHRK